MKFQFIMTEACSLNFKALESLWTEAFKRYFPGLFTNVTTIFTSAVLVQEVRLEQGWTGTAVSSWCTTVRLVSSLLLFSWANSQLVSAAIITHASSTEKLKDRLMECEGGGHKLRIHSWNDESTREEATEVSQSKARRHETAVDNQQSNENGLILFRIDTKVSFKSLARPTDCLLLWN